MFINTPYDKINEFIDKKWLKTCTIDNDNVDMIQNMYSIISNAYNNIQHIKVTRNVTKNHTFTQETLTKIVEVTRFFPQQINSFLLQNTGEYKRFSFKIGKRTFTIHVYCYEGYTFDEYNLDYMISWFYTANRFAPDNECSRNLNIYLLMSPFTKFLPEDKNTIVEPKHVNSAFTYGCKENNKIVIFRHEEWEKVLLHETFHTYNFDFHANDFTKFRTFMKHTFRVQSDYELFETYCETWATLWTAAYQAYHITCQSNEPKRFINYVETLIAHEQQFTLIQSTKILNIFNMKYSDMFKQKEPKYRENTNVFCYYILKSLCLLHINAFLRVSNKCMNNPLNIIFDSKCELRWIDFFKKIYNHKETIKRTNDAHNMVLSLRRKTETNVSNNSLGRMTLFG